MKNYELKAYSLIGEETNISVPISGYDEDMGLPILDIPMMSDERWNELCIKKTMENYKKLSGMGEALDYETALEWEKKFFSFESEKENKEAHGNEQRAAAN